MQSNLDNQQKQAVSLEFGPALILAGPGSGKTFVIGQRVLYLIQKKGVLPNQILVLTFTKAAADELKERACKLLPNSIEKPFFGTFHSFFYQVLKSTYEFRTFSILTKKQKFQQLKQLLKTQYGLEKVSNYMLQDILSFISKYKNDIVDYSAEHYFSYEELVLICKEYDYYNYNNKTMDYDDIICYALKVLKQDTKVLDKVQKEVAHILVDEFQDVNKKQYELLILLAGKRGNIYVVGDDDQSIYGFRGAGEQNVFQFEKDFEPIQKVFLGSNYRCAKEIVELSSKVISHNQKRFAKELFAKKSEKGAIVCRCFISKEKECVYISDEVKKNLLEGNVGDIAILCRTNRQLDMIAESLKSRQITYVKKEKSAGFYEQYFIKPVIAYMLFASGRDRSRETLFCFLNKPTRYVKREIFTSSEYQHKKLYDIKLEDSRVYQILVELEKSCSIIDSVSPVMAILYILKVIGYEEYVLALCKNSKEREDFLQSINELKERAGLYKSIGAWMDYVLWERENEIETGSKICDNQKEKVFLYTYHGAKGLEFEQVFLPFLNNKSVPYGKALAMEQLEEERRMFYVALTRCKKKLYLSYVENDTKKDTVSVFLSESQITASK